MNYPETQVFSPATLALPLDINPVCTTVRWNAKDEELELDDEEHEALTLCFLRLLAEQGAYADDNVFYTTGMLAVEDDASAVQILLLEFHRATCCLHDYRVAEIEDEDDFFEMLPPGAQRVSTATVLQEVLEALYPWRNEARYRPHAIIARMMSPHVAWAPLMGNVTDLPRNACDASGTPLRGKVFTALDGSQLYITPRGIICPAPKPAEGATVPNMAVRRLQDYPEEAFHCA